jgi:hypothetical protein
MENQSQLTVLHEANLYLLKKKKKCVGIYYMQL